MSRESLSIRVLKPGLMTTLQDGGRIGHQAFGVPVSGPMDHAAAQRSNTLVGNAPQTTLMEITIMGPVLEINKACTLALTGGLIQAQFEGQDLPMNQTIHLNHGGILKLGRIHRACRSYLSIAGDWAVKSWLDSSSWFSKSTTPDSWLFKGQLISILKAETSRTILEIQVPALDVKSPVVCLPGPEYGLLSASLLKQFTNQVFQVDPASNRMGYRLTPGLTLDQPLPTLLSSSVLPGTVQLTPSGRLIILLADAQTTGGYHRIAQIPSAQLDRLAQYKPGDAIHFSFSGISKTNLL